MAANAFADWLERGRTHQNEGRPADAIPCFRRAAREDPRSPVPHFHLGEALWQLGLTTDALQAWRTAAGLDRTFLPPRLALAEAAMIHGDFAGASVVAREAVALAPQDARARATSIAASAAAGDRGAVWPRRRYSPPIRHRRMSHRSRRRSLRSPPATSATRC